MPQLDLTWFFFNFLIAWILVLLVLSVLYHQNWSSETDQEQHTNQDSSHNNQWRW
uniref:ATP synthase complex subunit 8 n=1 Tax=Holothuria forskali TaxID=72674 RepID=D3H608_9ECHN|nr:ATP synthase F0 subunit 8 [Holothuria forskali]CBH40182.1 ATPase subunit 8 [Holothuria forskali]